MYHQKPLLGELPDFSHPLTPNVAAWIMNENSGNKIYDIINGNHGTFGAGAAAPTWVPSRAGPALYFDGGDYINCGNDTRLNNITNEITIEAWVNIPDLAAYLVVVGKYAAAGNRSFLLYFHAAEEKYQIHLRDTSDVAHVAYSPSATAGVFQHVVAVYNGANIIVYLNGIPGTPVAWSGGTIKTSTANLWIGNSEGYDNPFKDMIDVVGIYNRALSASGIWQLYTEPYCWLAQPMEAELMYAAPPVGVMSPYYYETLMAGAVI